MKTDQINLRTSPEDMEMLEKAARKLQQETGKKPDASKTIRTAVKQLANSKPDLFYINRPALRDVEKNITVGREMIQTLFDLTVEVGIPIKSIDEIKAWFGGFRSSFMVFDSVAFEQSAIDKLLEIQKKAYPTLKFGRENIQLPDLTGVFEAAEKLRSIPDVAFREVGVYWQCYQLTDSKVQVINESMEQVKNQYRSFATTTEERARLSMIRELCETLNTFINKISNPDKLNVRGFCFYDSESNRFEPAEDFVKFGL